MSRSRRTFPLHWKFTLGFLLIFSISTVSLYSYISQILAEQTRAVIREDMTKLQGLVYDQIQQRSLMSQSSENVAADERSSLFSSISRSIGHPIVFFDKEGTFVEETFLDKVGTVRFKTKPSNAFMHHLEEERKLSLENKSVVTMLQEGNKHLAILTLPYYTNDQYDGMLRLTSDYSVRYKHNEAILRSFAWFAGILFIAVTIFSYLLASRMTRPLVRLSRAMKGFGEGRQSEEPLLRERNDEAGQLTASFNQMKEQLEEQLTRLAAERNRIAELEQSKRRFYQQMTHELKTPLTSISGYAQIIGEPNFDDPVFLMRAAERIKTESDRLSGMVAELLEQARREETEPPPPREPFDLDGQLASCCEDMELKAARYDMNLKCELQAGTIVGEKDELRKVWVNLFDNAIKYGTPGTKIFVHAFQEEERAIIEVRNESSSGLENDELLVFKPFYRSNESLSGNSEGIGLGLSICRTIVGRHEGTIVFRQEDSGVVVRVELPIRS
ncbi:sensor histidine kinase [Paenibacillus sp. NPDC058071]|uniref:sensor histidine kinase n=1 Tax=Paenibacillus sp. NPDC058071 TaxID=3346326 RepID=UPI0036DF9A98